MRLALLSALVLCLPLAGCMDDGSPTTGGSSGTATSSGTGEPFCCLPIESATFRVEVDGEGAFAIGVPFPHMEWCLGAESWMSAMNRSYENVGTVEWREVDRGDVLWMEGSGEGLATHELVLDVTNRGRCQTFRYDPWSVEPEPADGTVDVFAAASQDTTTYGSNNETIPSSVPTQPATVVVEVGHRIDDCVSFARYEGAASGGRWVALPGDAGPVCPPSDTGSLTWTGTTSTSSSTSTATCSYGHCDLGHTLSLFVYVSDEQPREVGVPFPHGDWCLQPEDWDLGHATVFNATVEIRDSDRGKVLWVSTVGRGHATVSLDLEGRTTCQTFRYDPWSIEPDPAEGTVDVLAPTQATITFQVQEANGYCYSYDEFRGAAGPSWTSLAGTTGMVCQ